MEGSPSKLSKEEIIRWLEDRRSEILSFLREVPPALLLAAALALTIYVVQKPASVIDQAWPHFEVFHRGILWLLRSTAFRSIVTPLVFLVGYGLAYYTIWIRGRRFIIVSDFRVWGSLEKKHPAKGIAGRLQDELMRLLDEMRAPQSGLPTERARAEASAAPWTSEPKPILGGGFVPETQVSLQYEGISLEGLHTFFRRVTGRELVITGDLFSHPNGFLIVARTRDYGPWEVLVGSLDAISLGKGLQRLAIRILTTLSQGFLPKEANNFVFLQFKAAELEEYDLLIRLADLVTQTASAKYEKIVQLNFAGAYYQRGTWHLTNGRPAQARLDFKEAIDWCPEDLNESDEALIAAGTKLSEANKSLGFVDEAEEALKEVAAIQQRRASTAVQATPSPNEGGEHSEGG